MQKGVVIKNRLLKLGSDIGFFTALGGDCVQGEYVGLY
jgi:hypothetical protein